MLPAEGSAASAGAPRSELWLDHVHPYEHDFLTTSVFCPVLDVPRFGDDAPGPKDLFVAALTELGEAALQNVRERGALLMAMEPSNSEAILGARSLQGRLTELRQGGYEKTLGPGGIITESRDVDHWAVIG